MMNRIRPAKKMTCVVWMPFWCLLASGALAQDDVDREKQPADPSAEPELSIPGTRRPSSPQGASGGIESYLQLPDDFITTSPYSVAGASEAEWRRRFKKATSALSEAKTSLEATKRELDGVADGGGSSQWSVAPPGGGGGDGPPSASTSPLSFRLRQQLRADRDRIDTTEKAMRELRIEADLAGVPESWRSSEGGDASDGGGGSDE
jgi:hypothetical protein